MQHSKAANPKATGVCEDGLPDAWLASPCRSCCFQTNEGTGSEAGGTHTPERWPPGELDPRTEIQDQQRAGEHQQTITAIAAS